MKSLVKLVNSARLDDEYRRSRLNKRLLRPQPKAQQGFALAIAMAMGLIMTTMGIAALFVAQNDRTTAVQRRTSGSGLFVAEGGVARTLAQLQQPNNSLLLVRNYDALNSRTGRTYLGPDGVPNTGDEESLAVDEWSGYDLSAAPCFQSAGVGAPNLVKAGTIGTGGTYSLKAYRYDKAKQMGTFLIEGIDRGQESYIAVTISVKPDLKDFPGILTTLEGKPGLRGRNVLGSNGNVYYPPANSPNPSLSGRSAPGDLNRSSYLSAVWSGSSDGASGDPIEGKIFACRLSPTFPDVARGTNKGTISDLSSMNELSGAVGGITYFKADSINLTQRASSLKVDTTDGPVYLYVNGNINLRGNAQIINYRRDGKPPQVGDFRLMVIGEHEVKLEDTSCIQDVFLYNPTDDLYFFTSGRGCSSGRNTNFEGVIWMESILSSKNNSSNRTIPYYPETQEHNSTLVSNATSGIAVSSDLSSLRDLIEYIDWPVRYRIGEVKTWQRVRL